MTPPDTEPLLTEAEAAEFLSMSLRTLQYWRYAGTGLPHYRLGRAVRYRRSDLTTWLAARTVAPAPNDRNEDRPSASNSDPSDILSSANTKGNAP